MLNLLEIALLINCSFVTDQYLFQCLKGRRTCIGIENLGPNMVGPGKSFKIEVLIWLENAMCEFDCCK